MEGKVETQMNENFMWGFVEVRKLLFKFCFFRGHFVKNLRVYILSFKVFVIVCWEREPIWNIPRSTGILISWSACFSLE